ncbi:MAG TPA: hypothetical protein DD727_02400, partial [Clostridiales bacterium]|nr:hypothetical protein [Clostridiales bacterium]
GPDDWGQFRSLARDFAARMGHEGGYCIMQHYPGTSSYIARTWAVITELKQIAPKMKLLEMQTACMEQVRARKITAAWLKKYGRELKGIISADDCYSQKGINAAVEAARRRDVIRTAAGNTLEGMQMVKAGTLQAITYQSAEIDGMLPLQLAADWFRGLTVEPIRYLPVHIITAEDVDLFLSVREHPFEVNTEILRKSIGSGDVEGTDRFFSDLRQEVNRPGTVTRESLYGFLIEILAHLISIIREKDLETSRLSCDGSNLYKNLFMQKNLDNALQWLHSLALEAAGASFREGRTHALRSSDPVDAAIAYIRGNFTRPLSLKTLAAIYGLSPNYLGQRIRVRTGMKFNDLVNRLRVEHAQNLLAHTAMSARQAAVRSGFADPDYFLYVFRKYTGSFPADYVKSLAPGWNRPSDPENR